MGRLSPDEVRLWRAMRDVAPLPGRRPQADPEPPHPPADPPRPAGEGRVGADGGGSDRGRPARNAGGTPAVQSPPPLDQFAGVDRATAERVRRGRYPVEGTLDLHGMTQAEAHRALSAFVAAARTGGRRCLLVVTGHGRTSGGVLKAAVPRWLAEPELRRHLLATAPARPQHGGAGALYLLLRRLPR